MKGSWTEELPFVLWAYRTTARNATGETPFSLAYGIDAIVPAETEIPTFWVETFNEENNDEAMRLELDLIKEKRSEALTRLTPQKRKVEIYYNSKIKRRTFAVGIYPSTRRQSPRPKLGKTLQDPRIHTRRDLLYQVHGRDPDPSSVECGTLEAVLPVSTTSPILLLWFPTFNNACERVF